VGGSGMAARPMRIGLVVMPNPRPLKIKIDIKIKLYQIWRNEIENNNNKIHSNKNNWESNLI
jgi:hypothetical protein